KFSPRHRRRYFQFGRCIIPDIAYALARNPSKKLVAQFARQKFPRGLRVRFGPLHRAVVNQHSEGHVRLSEVAQEWTAFFQICWHVIYVDYGHNKLRAEDGNVACALILFYELFDWLGIEWLERTRVLWRASVKLSELLMYVRGHQKI